MNWLKSILILTFLFIFSHKGFTDEKVFTGKVTLRDGRVIKALNIELRGFSDREKVRFSINSQKYQIEPEKISELNFIETKTSNGMIESGSTILVQLKNGKSAIATETSIITTIYLTFLDQFTGERVTQTFYIDGSKDDDNPADVIRIVFIGSGNLKFSKSSNMFFPPVFSFDPYTGEELSVVQASEPESQIKTHAFKKNSTHSNSASEHDLLTEKALEYAKAMVNPTLSKRKLEETFSEFKNAAEQAFSSK